MADGMPESSTAAGNRLGGGMNDFQKTGGNNWDFPPNLDRIQPLVSDIDSVSKYSRSTGEERSSRSRDKGKGRATSKSRSRSRSRSCPRSRPKTRKLKHGSKRPEEDHPITRPHKSKSRSGRRMTQHERGHELVDLEANYSDDHREQERRRGMRQLGHRRRKQGGALATNIFGMSYFWPKLLGTVVALAIFFGLVAFFVKKCWSDRPSSVKQTISNSRTQNIVLIF